VTSVYKNSCGLGFMAKVT